MPLHLQSENKRNDALGASPISRIPLGELLQHQFFFVAKFNPETREHQERARKSAHVSQRERGGKKHGEYSGVDGMAHESVRPVLNQLVSLFQCHNTAPVASESNSGPKCEGQTDDAQECSRPCGRRDMGDDAQIEWIRQSRSIEQQEISDRQQDPVAQPLRPGFTIHRTLGRYRSDHPDRNKHEPATTDDIED